MKKQSVVVTKKNVKDDYKKVLRTHHGSEPEWEGWELGDLEDADEKALERRKQELQRELQLQMKKEKELTRKKDKKVENKKVSLSSNQPILLDLLLKRMQCCRGRRLRAVRRAVRQNHHLARLPLAVLLRNPGRGKIGSESVHHRRRIRKSVLTDVGKARSVPK